MSARLPLSPPSGKRVRLLLALLVAVVAFGALPTEASASLPALPADHQVGELVGGALAGDVGLGVELAALDTLEVEAQRVRVDLADALLASQHAPPDGLSLAPPPRLARLGTLLDPIAHPVEPLRFADLAPGDLQSLSKTRVWASSQNWPVIATCENRVSREDAAGYELGLVQTCVGRITTNLYAYVGWSPQSSVDPLGRCAWSDGECWKWVATDFLGIDAFKEKWEKNKGSGRRLSQTIDENSTFERLDIDEDSTSQPTHLSEEALRVLPAVASDTREFLGDTAETANAALTVQERAMIVSGLGVAAFEGGRWVFKRTASEVLRRNARRELAEVFADLNGVDLAKLTRSEIGELGESVTRRWLGKNGYTDIIAVQNRSGHGLDVVARSADGRLSFFEVKTSVSGRIGDLSARQSNMSTFIEDVLTRASTGTGGYSQLDKALQDKANQLLREFRSDPTKVSGTAVGVDLVTQTIRVSPW